MFRRDWLVQKHQESKMRVDVATSVANGQWASVWPNLSSVPEAPTVANLVEMGINHWTSVMGAVLPSIKVPINASAARSEAKRGARKRERRLHELWDASNLSETAGMLGGDYAGAGFCVMGAWVNFEEMDPAKRNPYLIRFDPRHTYTLRDNLGNVVEMLVARKISKGELTAMWAMDEPEYLAKFKNSPDEDVEEWFWYEVDRFFHAIVDVSKGGRKKGNWVVLVDEPNELGCVPVYETVRPTFDGQRRGVFDQAIHILHTMQRLMLLTIQSTEENSFPAIGEFDVQNPEDFGPGGVVHYRSPEGKIERLGPSTHFDVKDLIGRLEEEARMSAAFPQQLIGEPGASIVSARGINQSMGALDARLALAHKQFEVMFETASSYLLQMDQVYCDGEKTILGGKDYDEKAETFIPSRDINGAYQVVCTYGIGAGSDPANMEMRIHMHLGGELISKETAREQLPFLDDPEQEPIRILRENMQTAMVLGLMEKAKMGDTQTPAAVLKLLRSDDLDIDTILEKITDLLAAPPAPEAGQPLAPPGPGGAAEAALGAESLARGGVPGQAAQAPPSLGLPPLGDLMGQDSRMAV
jgi:hypothetical protein